MALTTFFNIPVTTGSANTKGAYSQVTASTPYASSRICTIVMWGNPGYCFLDIASGAAGAEVVIVPNIVFHSESSFLGGSFASFSVDIPAGTRLAVRGQSSASAVSLGMHLYLDSRPLGGLTNPISYGAVAATSRGTQLDPGVTINTKGAYVQLTASTTSRIDSIVICTTTITNPAGGTSWKLDIATGAVGLETVIIENIYYGALAAIRCPTINLPISIPIGSRIAARCECDAASRILAVSLIGMQEPTPVVLTSAVEAVQFSVVRPE